MNKGNDENKSDEKSDFAFSEDGFEDSGKSPADYERFFGKRNFPLGRMSGRGGGWKNGKGHRRGHRKGRRRCRRRISAVPDVTFFKPAGVPLRESSIVNLTYAELEAIRLADLEGLTQEKAAEKMGISRRTFWGELKNAREKVATALTKGYAIRIEGGRFLVSDK